MKKVICLLMACAALASVVPANAIYVDEEPSSGEVVPFYIGTILATASLSIDADGNATCSGRVRLVNGYTAAVTLSIQQKINGKWIIQKSWSERGEGDITLSKSYSASSGFSYQTIITAKVYNSEGVYVETVSTASAVVPF